MPYYNQPERIATVQEALNQHTVDILKKLASLLPGGKVPTRKNELVDYILPYLQGQSLKQLWSQCDQIQQATIAETVHSPIDGYQQARFVSKYGKVPSWGTSGGFSYGYNFNATVLDLFFYSYTMPQDLKKSFQAFVPPPEPTSIKSTETISSTLSVTRIDYDYNTRTRTPYQIEFPLQLRETEQVARRELLTILRLVDLGKIVISDKTFYPTGATLTTIGEVLEEGDYYSEWTLKKSPGDWRYDYPIGHIKPFAWVMLLQAGKLVELSGKKLALTKAGQKALIEPAEKTLQLLWKNWQKTTLLDELRRIDGIKGQTGKGKRGLTAVSGRRSQIVAALKECPVGAWIKIGEFLRYILAAGHEFIVSRTLEHLTIGDTGGFYELDFLLVEARYVVCFLFEYAATLGLIDVSFLHPDDGYSNFTSEERRYDYMDQTLSRYDGLAYIRITPLGAYILGISDSPQERLRQRYTPQILAQKQVLRILPNLEVVAVEQLSRADRLVLDSCLQSVSDSVWKLDRDKLLDAISQGRNVDDLKKFLVANSGAALPQIVTQFLADLETRTTSLQDLGAARLIRCADPALAMLIANDSRTKAFCFLADTPKAVTTGAACYLVVPMETETKFRNALKKIGYSLPS
jgi:hypothetical protein